MQALDRHRRRIIYTREAQVHAVIRQVPHLRHFGMGMNSAPEIARFWSTPVLSSPARQSRQFVHRQRGGIAVGRPWNLDHALHTRRRMACRSHRSTRSVTLV